MDTVTNLWSGRTGLAKTYWLWGVLSGIPWGLALSLVTPGSQLAIVTVLACVMYYVIVHVGIWRAASQYQGFKAWAILAKIAVAITPACLVIGTLAAIVIPAMHQPSRQGPHQTTPATNSSEMNDKPRQPSTSSEAPGEIDFFLLMAAPHASEVSDYNKILQAHPDAVQISQNNNFRQWVLSNPKTWNVIKSHDADGLIAIFSEFKSKH